MDSVSLGILALVQGVTEFLPVSSSAHLVLAGSLTPQQDSLAPISVALHGATLIALLVYFFGDIRRLAHRFLRGHHESRSYVLALFLATVPMVASGALLYPLFVHFATPASVALTLIISGLTLFIADQYAQTERKWTRPLPPPKRLVLPLPLQGLLVGLAQLFAVLPGVSRSGVTMTAGRLVGFSRTESVRFSFLLGIPVLYGALLFAAFSALSGSAVPLTVSPTALGIASVATFLLALGVIRLLLRVIERVGFAPFCVYQIVLGALVLVTMVVQ